ncbi:MAG: protein-L-isoaspartate O-methyltransferase, partial [bacterium]
RILVTAGAPELPGSLRNQAAETARIVIPEGSESKQKLTIYSRDDGGEWSRTASISCVFVPLKGDEGWDGH